MEMACKLRAEQARSLLARVPAVSIPTGPEEQDGRRSVDPRWSTEEGVPHALKGRYPLST